jgi:extracellular factor (EF) 3-hydroxypalmitic acid methyl ester biosynthesis protein
MTRKISASTDSVVAFRNSQGTEAQGTLLRLNRESVVFEVYNPYSIVQLSEVLSNLRMRRGERDVYTGRAVVTNLINTGLMAIVSASLVDPWSDLASLSPGPELRDEVQGFVEDWDAGNRQLHPAYQVAVSNVRNFLEELSRWLGHGEMVAGITAPGAAPELIREFTADVDSTVAPKLDELFGVFEEMARKVPEDEVAVHKAFARREIHPLTMCAPFMHRTYTKPLGYAGDYEMVRMILRDPLEGQNSYAKVVNSVLLRSGTAEAHRNRIVKLTEYLVAEARRVNGHGRPFKVLNIGCGPAAEVERFLQHSWLSDRANLHLLDFNQETLAFAEEQITRAIREHRRRAEVKFIHRSVHELLKQASGRNAPSEEEFEFVYCAGLFDYLNDRICGRLLKLFYSWTLPGGFVVATNVHPKHPVRGFLEHLQEWYLIVRDERQMQELAPELGQQAVTAETTGVNVFLEIRKPDKEGVD